MPSISGHKNAVQFHALERLASRAEAGGYLVKLNLGYRFLFNDEALRAFWVRVNWMLQRIFRDCLELWLAYVVCTYVFVVMQHQDLMNNLLQSIMIGYS